MFYFKNFVYWYFKKRWVKIQKKKGQLNNSIGLEITAAEAMHRCTDEAIQRIQFCSGLFNEAS